MTTTDPFAVNQLLGRLTYFHVLFIEPALPSERPENRPATPCCLHDPSQAVTRSAPRDIITTPWIVLVQIAEEIGAAGCRADSRECCPACRIHACATAIVATWIATENRAYGYRSPHAQESATWSLTVADAITAIFTDQHRLPCTRTRTATPGLRPTVDRFPLSGELAQLWCAPDDTRPVTSWLNHCAALEDVTRHLRQRSIA